MFTAKYAQGVCYAMGELAALQKVAGGPGSGVSGNNTKPIGLPLSEHVSVGTRKALLENMHYRFQTIPLDQVEAVHQEKYVTKKLKWMIAHPDVIREEPIDVLQVGEGRYHLCDGAHRYLAAKELGLKEIKARVRKKARVTHKPKDVPPTILRKKLREG